VSALSVLFRNLLSKKSTKHVGANINDDDVVITPPNIDITPSDNEGGGN